MVNEDITQLDYSTLFQDLKGKITVVIGGPPCQGFSQRQSKLLGTKEIFCLSNFTEVVKYLKPKYFLIENVPNLLTSNKGFFKDEIYRLLKQKDIK